ncbi:hypothetical protein OO009_08945 [Flavobacteriaceae bacterium KMM 6897]|nr:hypothetical protein [Flavobacteriaceae bacterium KMM 6897]MEB8344437.1 hypothetical protein [Flavobacteriaceae bacterium KMM 6898]
MNTPKLRKLLIGFFMLNLIGIGSLNAQTIVPKDGSITHNGKLRPCILVSLDPKPDDLKEAWRDYLSDTYDFKLKGIGFLKNKDLLSAEDVIIQKISQNKINFYTNIVESELGSEMKVFASLDNKKYINQKDLGKEYKALNNIVENFLNTYLPIYYQEMLEDTNKNYENLSKDVANLNEEIVDDSEKIEELKKEIKDLSDKLESNRDTLEKTKLSLKSTEEKLVRIKAQSLIYNK